MLYMKTFFFHMYEKKITGFFFVISLSFLFLSSFELQNIKNFSLNFKNYITLLSNKEIQQKDLFLKDLVIKQEEKPTQKYLFAYNVFLKSSKEEERLYVANMFKSILRDDVLILEKNIVRKNFFYNIFYIFNLFFLIGIMLMNFSKNNLTGNKIHFLFKSFLVGMSCMFFIFSFVNYIFFASFFKLALNFIALMILFCILWVKKIA